MTEFEEFYDRYRSTMWSFQHTEDEWEYFIPKMKLFEVARRIKTISTIESDYQEFKRKESGYRKDITKQDIIEDFYQFCRGIERDKEIRKKITKIKNRLNE